MNELLKEKNDNEILFSKTVKAGKRIYYIDVKIDRRNELYLSITESKRLKDGSGLDARPVYEKHKIFLYREDMERFMAAFQAATAYVHEHAAGFATPCSEDSYTAFITEGQEPMKDTAADEEDTKNDATCGKSATDFRIDFDF